jgi:hypothetical protein
LYIGHLEVDVVTVSEAFNDVEYLPMFFSLPLLFTPGLFLFEIGVTFAPLRSKLACENFSSIAAESEQFWFLGHPQVVCEGGRLIIWSVAIWILAPRSKIYYQMYRDVAKTRKLLLIDHYPKWEKILNEDPELFKEYVPDGIHPAAAGCKAVILPNITKALGIEAEQKNPPDRN